MTPTDDHATVRRGDDVSNRDGKGPNRIDWDAAEAFYLTLEPPRVLQRVVEKFAVSRVSVGRQAKQRRWREKAAELDEKATARANGKLVQSRAEQITQNLRIRDAAARRLEQSLIGDKELDEQLVIRAYEASDKIARLDAGEATDRIEVSEVNRLVLVMYRVAGEFVPADRRGEFLERLDSETSGMLELGPGTGE